MTPKKRALLYICRKKKFSILLFLLLALLFSATLAPVAGEFGVIAGLLAGFLHASVAMNVGIVYGGMNLYNNGFAGGIVAIFMVPVIHSIRDRRARAGSDISL